MIIQPSVALASATRSDSILTCSSRRSAPPKATPTADDDRFQIARELVSKVIKAPEAPADVRQAAMDRVRGVYDEVAAHRERQRARVEELLGA